LATEITEIKAGFTEKFPGDISAKPRRGEGRTKEEFVSARPFANGREFENE
jgi:hypothetical protein